MDSLLKNQGFTELNDNELGAINGGQGALDAFIQDQIQKLVLQKNLEDAAMAGAMAGGAGK